MNVWTKPEEAFHAHFDCFSGAAGDMMLASCIDAAGDKGKDLLRYVISSLQQGLPEIAEEFSMASSIVWRGSGSIAATYVEVRSVYNHESAPVPQRQPLRFDHDHSHDHTTHENSHTHSHEHVHTHEHSHSKSNETNGEEHNHSHANKTTTGPLRNFPQIKKMLLNASEMFIPIWVKENAIAAFSELAHAEAHVHGAKSIDQVHFHEVGAIDSIVDTVGTLLALHALGVVTVSCSRLPLGEGTVRTAHGILPVPAPATLWLMQGMPTTPGPPGITGELVTPTAAALLRVLTKERTGRPPRMILHSTGIGAGTKNFSQHPNVLRLLLGKNIVLDDETNRSLTT